jgi:recombination protein RecT
MKTQTQTQKESDKVIVINQHELTKNVLIKVNKFIENKELKLPEDYSPENAIKSACLIINELKNKDGVSAFDCCTTESITNALYNMVFSGLTPVKKQCRFSIKENKLEFYRTYFGSLTLAKRFTALKDAVGTVVYTDDLFEYMIDVNGRKKVIKHLQKIENIDINKIKAIYATLTFKDDTEPYIEIMTMQQIRTSWMLENNTLRDEHKKFPDQMGIRTVIERALKLFLNSSDDAGLYEETNIQETEHIDVPEENNNKVNIDSFNNDSNIQKLSFSDDNEEKPAIVVNNPEAADTKNIIKRSF